MSVPVRFEVRYEAPHGEIGSCEVLDADDSVKSLKDRLSTRIQQELQMGPQDVRIQALYEQDGEIHQADARLNVGTFHARQGYLLVRGASGAAALRLSALEGLSTLE